MTSPVTSPHAGDDRSHQPETSSTWQWIDPLGNSEWSRLLARHPRASIFQTSGWLDALKRTYGYEPVTLALVSPDGSLSGGAVFCRIRSWITGRRLVSLPFSDYCDPLFAGGRDVQTLAEALQRESSRWNYVEVRPRDGNPTPGFEPAAEDHLHRLTLTGDPADLLPRFHKNHVVRKIRRGEREALVYEEGRSDRLVRSFYELLLKTRRRHGLPPQPLTWFRNILECLPEQAKVRVAFKNRTPVASMITLCHGGTMVYKYGASDARFHNLGAMQLLMWRTIQDACSCGCSILDLGRSRIDNAGEVAYKENWAATRESLVYCRYPEGHADEIERTSVAHARRVFRHLPDTILIAAGRLLYKHIG